MTSTDHPPWAQIVLSIREVHGLGFTSSPLVIVASLNKNRLESDVIHPFSTKLDVEFVWEGELKEVKRLKQANTSIKVECFTVMGSQKRDKLGYIVLSLKQAVLILRDNKTSKVDAWHKLMGVRAELKKSEPKLLLALSLKEKTDEPLKENEQTNSELLKVPDSKITPLLLADEGCEKIVHRATSTKTKEPDGKLKDIQFTLTEKEPTKPTTSPIKEQPTLPAVSEELDDLKQSKIGDEGQVRGTLIKTSRKHSTDNSIHHYTLRISFEYVMFEKLPANGRFHIRLNHKSAEILCTVHDDISIADVNKMCNLSHIEADLRLQSSADQINALLLNESPVVQICDTNGVFTAAILDLGILFSQPQPDLKSFESVLICTKDEQQKIEHLVARLNLRDCGILLQSSSNCEKSQQNWNVAFDRSLAERIVEELEDWKERQQELFLAELKKKESEHLSTLTAESMKRRKEIEDNLKENVNKYQAMAIALNEANDKIKELAKQNEEKAKQLKLEEEDLHRKFNIKLQELREASKRMEADVNHKLSLASTERNELVDKINHLIKAEKRAERVKQTLEEEINNLRGKTVSKEEFEKVTQNLKDVEHNLHAALESKAFYKAQWGKSVREIHRLKKELQEAMDKQLQRERLEVFKIKLSQQAKEQENELMDDRSMLKNLQKETQDYMLKKCSTYS